jgi:hypothetical protein
LIIPPQLFSKECAWWQFMQKASLHESM